MTEYKVRPVTRYIVTEFISEGNYASSRVIGEFDNETNAEWIAAALRKIATDFSASDIDPTPCAD